MVIEHADFDGTERLAAVLGADIISTFDNPENAKLGTCGLIEEIMIVGILYLGPIIFKSETL